MGRSADQDGDHAGPEEDRGGLGYVRAPSVR